MTIPLETIDLAKLRLQWVIGDWTALAAIGKLKFSGHPDRRALILLAIVGSQQLGLYNEARELILQAISWKCSKEEIARWMLSGIYNSLGRALFSAARHDQGMDAYRHSISFAPSGLESEDLSRARANHQSMLMADERIRRSASASKSGLVQEAQQFKRPPNGITSYAQNFEDVMLWRALGSVKDGFYIDIGAQDPIVDSVSKAFYEKGWRGVHVEPTKAYAEKIRKDRPDEYVVEAAVNDSSGEIKFFEIPGTGISTGDSKIAQGHVVRGFGVTEISVPCVSLAEVMEHSGDQDIHWLKIDVEGMEGPVLRSWGSSPKRPWIVVVESTLPLTEISSYAEWESQLTDRGYEYIYFDGLNRFYLSEARAYLRPAFQSGPNVFDNCTLAGLASATFYRR